MAKHYLNYYYYVKYRKNCSRLLPLFKISDIKQKVNKIFPKFSNESTDVNNTKLKEFVSRISGLKAHKHGKDVVLNIREISNFN